MNKIYQMTENDIDTTPLVSNIIVSDIRDDINRSTPVCTFNEYGICYKDTALVTVVDTPITIPNEILRTIYFYAQEKPPAEAGPSDRFWHYDEHNMPTKWN